MHRELFFLITLFTEIYKKENQFIIHQRYVKLSIMPSLSYTTGSNHYTGALVRESSTYGEAEKKTRLS